MITVYKAKLDGAIIKCKQNFISSGMQSVNGDFFSQAEVALKVLLLQNRQCCKYQEAIFLFKMIKHDLIGNFRDTCGTIP